MYRTTPVEYNLNYSQQLPSVKLPVAKAGLSTINYTFNEPLPINDLPNITFDQWKEWAHINGN